jgi:hypothetical protein
MSDTTGRRPGQSGTREKILAAARQRVCEARLRPSDDPRHRRGGQGLPFDPTEFIPELLAPGVDGTGERVVRKFVELWDSREGAHLLGLIRSLLGNESAAAMMREFLTHVLGRIAAALGVSDPQQRAALVASQVMGLAMARYVVRLEPVASASADDLARWIGPNVRRYFTADLRKTPSRRA